MRLIDLVNNKILLFAFLTIIVANPIWPLFGFFTFLSYFFLPILLFATLVIENRFLSIKINYLGLLALFSFILVFLAIPMLYTVRMSSYAILLTYVSIWVLRDDEKRLVLSATTKFLAIIISISLPFWLIHVFITPFPVFATIDSILAIKDIEPMNNYILFISNGGIENNRFYAMFDEPGVLGTLSAFILYANKYNFKKNENIVILLGALFTFSLAFYVLFFVGYILFNSRKLSQLLLGIISIIFIGATLWYLLRDNLIFQLAILDRFVDIGSSADKRSSEFINNYFSSYIGTSNAIFGLGTNFFSNLGWSEGSSYKDFILEYGIIGGISLLLLYLSLMKRINRYTFILLILFTMSFIQRPFAFTSWQILLFSCACANLNYLPDSNAEYSKSKL